MKKTETYDEYAALCSARLRGKVCTNEFPDAERCRREIEAGVLYTEETEGALLLFRKQEDHLRMNFYLHSREKLQFPTDVPIVTEIAYRERDKALAETVDYWRQQGFSLCFHRMRLCLSSELPPSPTDIPVRVADLTDADNVASYMKRNFDPLTGCLPLRHELESSLQNGEILLTEHGILQFARGRVSAKLRHLAVDEPHRGRGEAQALLTEFRREFSGQKNWFGFDREIHLPKQYIGKTALYRMAGYRPFLFAGRMIDLEKLLEILRELRPDVDFEKEKALIDDGILESLDIVAIVGEIMDAFNVELNVEDLLPENFNSAEAMLELIRIKEN